eukprot:1138208-Pelagomonas_calceolata.AAC.4
MIVELPYIRCLSGPKNLFIKSYLLLEGSPPNINKGKGDTLAQKSHKSLPPYSRKRKDSHQDT